MTTEVIEAEAVEVPPERAVVRAEPPRTQIVMGAAQLALMGEEEFERNLRALETARKRALRIQQALMVEGTDFGKVPGIDRPFLHKPGAETLDKAFGLAIRFEATRVIGEGEDEPPIAFHVKGFAHVGNFDGPTVAQGYGEANAWEERYRWRKAERTCPDCGKPNIIKSRPPRTGWWCGTRDGGCGHSFQADDERITGQQTGRLENADPWGLANTLLKMAVKRAHVDTTLRATGTSGLFTQDEDSPVVRGGGPSLDEPIPVEDYPPAPPPTEREFRGKVSLGTSSPSDGVLRQSPEGPFIGFKLALTEGGNISQVVARGELAQDIADACAGDLKALKGSEVVATGFLESVPWDKDGVAMPRFKRLTLTRLATPDWTLPEAVPA